MLAQDSGVPLKTHASTPMKAGEPIAAPGGALITGPEADKYRALLKDAEKLNVSRAQLIFLDSQVELLRMLAGSDPVENAKRLDAEKKISAASQNLRSVQAEFMKKYGIADNCNLDGRQEPICPPEAKTPAAAKKTPDK